MQLHLDINNITLPKTCLDFLKHVISPHNLIAQSHPFALYLLTCFFFSQGATVKRDETTGAIVVARIMKGGAADKSGEFMTGSK